MFENPSGGMQANNVTTNVPKILVLKSSSEQIFSENCRWVPPKSVYAAHSVNELGDVKLFASNSFYN